MSCKFQEDFLPLHEFYFTPENVAPTVRQKFPNLVTDTVLITGKGDVPLLDGRYDWIIDSGSTSNMTNNKTLFSDFQERESKVITTGKATSALGYGTVDIRLDLGEDICVMKLQNVLLVPTLPINLISLSCLDENHYISTKNGMEVRHRENDELVMRARKVGGLYVANLERHFDTALIAKEMLLLMHKHLGHINI